MIKERLLEMIAIEGLNPRQFYIKTGLGNGFLDKVGERLKKPSVEKISSTFPRWNIDYLQTGEGEMYCGDAPVDAGQLALGFKQKGYAPFYSELQVSAGQYDLATIEQKEEPESWIKFPGIVAEAWFPVVGCSMEPKIYAGDVVGVAKVERWDRVDPDKVYLIITTYERMVKHLEVDEESAEFLWATSPNHPRFKVYVNEISSVFRVIWAGRMV